MKIKLSIVQLPLLAIALAAGCAPREQEGSATTAAEKAVRVDGSSTVYPITEAVAEEFRAVQPEVRVTVGISGTGGGFKKFAAGEIDIADASRPIKPEEASAAQAAGIEYVELPVAYDGITMVVHPDNTFVDHLTMEELHKIWAPESTVKTWNEVRSSWPKEEIHLYGAGHDSGTFDYFTEVVNGKAQACRADYTASEDDNVLVQGVSGDKSSLGFFGFAYYAENQDKLRAVPIMSNAGAIAPSHETIANGTYEPLSRPIFIYVASKSAERPEVQSFATFYLDNAPKLVSQVGYIALSEALYSAMKTRLTSKVTGSVYASPDAKGKTLDQLYLSAT
jgi:phosphate transport system substrate-binding protein